jgi:putative FmdB family regulatory protein
MPTYVYRCLDCKCEYEMREGFDAPALQACRECGGTARRVIHAPPIVFKGSGFYVTDSRGSSDGVKSTPEAETAAATEPAKAEPEKKADAADKAESAAAT